MFNTNQWLSLAILLLPHLGLGWQFAGAADTDSVKQALIKSYAYLAKDGRAWFEGEIVYQKQGGCVSCHQVPTGLWGLRAAQSVLPEGNVEAVDSLWNDAVDFSDDDDGGAPAVWSQMLVAIADYGDNALASADMLPRFRALILESQEENGSWKAKGQFPSQLRPIAESDAVVSMWMVRGLNAVAPEDAEIQASVERALDFISQQLSGVSTEWIAWRALTFPMAREEGSDWVKRLLERRNSDGGWGWKQDSPSDAYSTGVALYALAKLDADSAVLKKAADYLLDKQLADGSWETKSGLISKRNKDSLDYIYRYWATAWATIGLSEFSSRGHS